MPKSKFLWVRSGLGEMGERESAVAVCVAREAAAAVLRRHAGPSFFYACSIYFTTANMMLPRRVYCSLIHIHCTVSPRLAINLPALKSIHGMSSCQRSIDADPATDVSKKPNPLSAELFSKLSAVPKPPELQTKIRQHVNPLSARYSISCCDP